MSKQGVPIIDKVDHVVQAINTYDGKHRSKYLLLHKIFVDTHLFACLIVCLFVYLHDLVVRGYPGDDGRGNVARPFIALSSVYDSSRG